MSQPSGPAPFLSAERRRLLAALLRDEGVDDAAGAEIPRRPDGAPAPLSPAQQRLWFIDRLEPGSDAYNVATALRLRGALDPAVLRRALGGLVRRHESLRTVFPLVDGEPVQAVLPAGPAALPQVDLGALPAGAREAELARLARAEARRPFDLARGPLLRALLVRLAPAESALLFTLHHVVSDGWSMGILVREVSALYAAFARGEPSPLPPLPVRYADYAAWQRERLADGRLEAQLAWWRERLAGAPPLLELPVDRPRPAAPSARGAEVRFLLPAATVRALGEWARRGGATPFMALLAGWKALLARYAAQDDVVVGTPTAGRDRAETEGVIGFFANTLVLRTDLSGDPTATELLARVRQTALGAQAHADVPFERLVEELRPERSLTHTPLFQVLFSHRTAEEERGLRLGDVEVEPLHTGDAAAKFDLTVELKDTGGVVGGVVSYRAELWDEPTVARMAERFAAVLAALAADPAGRLSSLPLLSPGERRRLLGEWNRPAPVEPAPPLLERVAEQAERTPGGVAVVHGGDSLTYAELHRRAGALALRLRALGVGPDARVGVCMERSVEQVVAVLATLRAGGACVPLDPAYPAERLAFMLADSGARVLLTQEGVRGRLPAFSGAVLTPHPPAPSPTRGEGENDAAENADTLSHSPSPESLAYLIYTSGSTGTPKGVGMPHRPLWRLVDWQLRGWNGPAAARTLQFASLSFDVSFQEIFATWASGGTLVLVSEEVRADLPRLARLLEEERIERLFLPFAALQHLAEAAGELGIAPASLREVVTAGEQLRVTEPIRRWLARIPGCVLVNQYGPSETHVATALALAGPAGAWPELPPIGRPVDGARCHVLDLRLQLAPPGIPGELFLGGECVARGYPGRPEATAERFVPDPFSPGRGARMYRTGDRARWTAAGELEFLGRVDQQVKVRGFRVEPGEVEAALERHPGVREAVVVAREDAPGDRRLVAYLVPAGDAAPAAAELREFLGRSLPEHLVPSAFVALEAIPLTPSGKIHRQALPAPAAGDAGPRHVPPRTPVEEILAGAWADVLRLERVGVEDDFFALGGHSLLATRVASRVRQALGVEVPLRALFEAPTVAGLARRVEALLREDAGVQAPPLVRAPRGDADPLPLSFAQQRLWFVHQLDPASPAFNMPFPLRLRGTLRVGALERALGELVRRHESLRTVFRAEDGGAVQVVGPPEPRVLPLVDLRGVADAQRTALWLAGDEARRPFDLERGPLLRATLVRSAEEDWALLCTLHHVVGDAWSTGVLVRELSALYGAYAAGLPSPLREPELQYADYTLWQRAWLTGEVLERQLAYWTERLAGAPPQLELPAAGPRPADAGTRGGVRTRSLAAADAAALRALSRREGASLFMTLLAGWTALLARYSGQTDVVVGTPIAGRGRRETEELVGFFLNTLALRVDLAGDPSFRQLVARTRETALGAYAHQDLPFERLLEALPVERSPGRTPVFQAMFNLVNTPDAALSLPGLAVATLPLEGASSRTDVSLYASERDGAIRFDLAYDAGLFEAERMEEMLRHLCALLAAAAADPELRLAALPLAAPPPRPRDPVEIVRPAGPTVEFPAGDVECSIGRRFARQAELHGGRVAVSEGGARVTYAELDAAVVRAARALVAERGAAEERVGVLLGHDATMAAGVLAALRAGKTYVPLDPRHPEERLARVLADARPGALLTDAAHLPLAARLAGGLPVLRADAPGDAHSGDPLPEVPPERPAYILYTSGSTGRPKGVVQSHRNVLHHVRAYAGALRIGPADRLSLFSSFAFDAAVMDVFGALLSGAALCPFDLRGEGSEGVHGWMRDEGITVFHSTPTVFRHLFGGAPPGGFPGVRLVVLGGEETGRVEVETFLRRFGAECVLVNGLGPTESTLALQAFLDRDAALRGGPVPVGFPVRGTRVALLNPAGEQPAVYGTGEIAVRSAHVALGYWDRPEATRAAFLPDPEGGPERTYLTGDLGRWLPDGSVQFLGRADHQVKVRGHRIEPGEVEAALLEHPGVREAAVAARPDPRGERRLVAWVAADGGGAPGSSALREHLRARLPEYMVPAAFVAVASLPRTASGKTDRLALPEPEWDGGAMRGEYRAPGTPAEQAVARVWAELLGVERVGADDDFFELGGHSLLAMQAVSRLRDELGTGVSLRALFEAPTPAGLAVRVDAGWGADGAPPPIRRVPRDPGTQLPLSFAQQRLWFLQQLDPGDSAYNLGGALRLTGALDAAALGAALDGVVRRHESLRTRILTTAAGEGVQAVDPPAPVPLPLDDLSALPPADRDAAARRRAAAEVVRPFDLERGPAFRVRLLRLDRDRHVLVFAMHHAVSDAWSSGVLAREVSSLYAAAAGGEAPELPELPVQYADYAVWQRDWLSGATLEAQLAWWRRALDGIPAALPLPVDRSRPAAATAFAGAAERLVLPPGLARGVAALARAGGATPFMALLAAWAALLGRYAGEDDVVVGTPVAGRTRPELEGLIGFFVNTLALRADLSGAPGFRALLGRVREAALGAFEHQELPFERLVDALGTGRDPGRHPVFQTMFALQNAPGGELRLGGLALEPLETEPAATPFELSLTLREGPGGTVAVLHYAADLFEAATARRMLEHFRALLEGAAAEPDRPVAALPLLAPEERRLLLEEWSGPPAPDAGGATVVEMIWAQAARSPDAPAVVLGERSLDFAGLTARADALARRLRRLGAGPERRVAVFLDRSLELPVALLGALRAGASYAPVDPELPPERVAFLLADTGAAVVLTRAGLRDRLPESGAAVLCLDGEDAGEDDGAPLPAVDPASLAYVIHTSGSTGTPKGAMVEHRSLAAFALAMAARLELGPGDRMLQFAALGFDVVVEELFPAWTHGAAVVLHEADLLDAPDELLRVLERRGVTGLELPTAYWHAWVHALALAGERLPAHVRFVIIGGERVSPERLAQWAELGTPLVHVYGLTETTVTTTTLALPAGDDGSAWSSLPIGRPVPGSRVYLLDAQLGPVPVGVPGELCVGGDGVGRGYLGRPAPTAERWVPDPFAEPGARMYRTGDRARWLADGTVEFLGRVDHQAKVRGFRVEPGEVEAALLALPQVREAVVAARPAPGGGARLVGWVVPAEGFAPAPEGLLRRPARPELWPSHGEYPVYDDLLYRAMAEDARRNAAYREALAEVAPGAVVLDVGTGGEAVLARLAVEAGARRVYAMEAMEASFRQARERVRELGLEDRITVLHGDAATVRIPEPVDVCVSELLGCVGSSEGAVAALDSVRRWLRPEGAMVPRRCVTRIAAARLPDELHDAPALEELGGHYAREVFGVVGGRFDLRLCVRNLPANHLLSPSAPFEELDFTRPGGDEWEREVELEVARGGRLDGLVAWIRLYAGERLGLDALEEESAWLPMFFPAFHPGVEVRPGDTLRFRCESRLSDDGVHPDYRMSGVLRRPGRADVPFAHHSVHHGPAGHPSPLHREVFGGGAVRTRPAAAPERVAWAELRARLGESLPAHMVPEALVALDALPLTRHGKLDRRALPDPDPAAAAGAFRAPEDPTEAALAGIWAAVLGLERVGADDNFFALGGDSILSIQVVARARAEGVRITPRQVFEHPTVAGLARAAREAAPAAAGEGGSAVGEAPLTPVQRWFFHQPIPDRHHWNVSALLEPREPLGPAVLEGAVAALLEHHDALRARFVRAEDGWRQDVPPAGGAVPVTLVDLGGLPEAEQRGALERAAAGVQRGLRLERGPLLRAALFERGAGRTQRVLLAVHHLVMDGVAWRVLTEDLETACDALSRGLPPALPPRTTPWRAWAERLAAHAAAPEMRAQADFWTAAERDLPPPLPVDFRRGPALEGTAASVAVSLDPEETRALLQDVPPVYRTRVDEVLLAALARAFAGWTGDARLRVELEGHGREELFPDVDLSRTVGWFTTQHPVLLDLRDAPGEGDALRAVKEQLRAVPDRGIGHGLLRWLSPDPGVRAALASARPPEVAFNYLGQFRDAAAGGGRFARAAESAGAQTGPRTPRAHLLAVNALVSDDRLRAWLSYSPELHERATVEGLAARFAAELRALVAHCRAPGAGAYTPSDFAAVRLDQRSLDRILQQVKG